MLQVTVENLGETVILHCVGRIVRGHETAILCPATRRGGKNVILDLGKVDAIDAAGVGAFIALQAAGIYLQLLNPTKAVREILQVTRLNSLFEICSSSLPESFEEAMGREQPAGLLPSQAVAIAI